MAARAGSVCAPPHPAPGRAVQHSWAAGAVRRDRHPGGVTDVGVDADEVGRVVEAADAAGVRMTRVIWCGNDGTVRAKAIATEALRARIAGGIGLTRAQQAQDSRDRLAPVPGMGPVGEMRLSPDPATFRVLPYAPRTAAMLADMVGLDGTPEPACPRGFLRRMTARSARHGLHAVAGFESEFSLAHGDGTPLDRSPCFSTSGALAAQDVMDAILTALDAQGIAFEGCHAEGGWGQQEIAFAPVPAMRAADEQVLVRETLRGVAAAHGLTASVAPKPFPHTAGNGLHIHVSFRDAAGRNALADRRSTDGLSPTALHAIGGLLAHLPALCALTAPSAGSYRRLVPRAWAGAWRCWGDDNREAAVRACSPLAGHEEASTNIELKPSDASASPHMALGAVIAAALDGIVRETAPPAPVAVDPAVLSDAERAEIGVVPVPRTAAEALDALEADDVLVDALGDELARSFIAVRRAELRSDDGADDDAALRY